MDYGGSTDVYQVDFQSRRIKWTMVDFKFPNKLHYHY